MSEAAPILVEWYRVDASRRVVRILAWAALGMLLGCFCVAGSVRTATTPDAVRLALTAVGFTFIVGGGLRAIFGLRRVLDDDAYIALRTDQLVFHDAGREVNIAWDAIEDVEVETAEGVVKLVMKEGEPTMLRRAFAGVTPSELAKRIAHVRRRVLFGLER